MSANDEEIIDSSPVKLLRSPLTDVNSRKIITATRKSSSKKPPSKLGAKRRLCLSNFGKKQTQSENNCLVNWSSPTKTKAPSSKTNLLQKFKKTDKIKENFVKREEKLSNENDDDTAIEPKILNKIDIKESLVIFNAVCRNINRGR